jgi:hypothetical protein
MKRWIATFLVLGAELLGGCAADGESGEPSNFEVEGRKEPLWTESCSQDQQSYVTGAIIGAYYSLQSALQTYSTDSDRVHYYFGVGYNDPQVQYTLANMWGVMNDQDLTVICAQQADNCHPEIVGQYNWAYVTPDDMANGVSRIQVCDLFFDPTYTPGEEETLASPAGLLLHEMAHLAGANDYVDSVGIHTVREYATKAPSQSYENADSYRYYIFNSVQE